MVVVKIGDEVRGQGEGARKKSAENQAAQQAYLALCQENGVKPAEVLTTLG